MELELRINGIIESIEAAPHETLLAMLRRKGLCSVKQGCETGECGACTVLVDGVPRPSCVMLAGQAGGCTLTTVEGLIQYHQTERTRGRFPAITPLQPGASDLVLGSTAKLHPLQEAFIEVGAVQCGFCTSGMLLSAYALLQNNASPTESEVRDALSGNLCRCTGYSKPVQAVMQAAAVMRGEKVAPVEYSTINGSQENISGITAQLQRITVHNTNRSTTKIPALSVDAATMAETNQDASLDVVGRPVRNIDGIKLVTGKPAFVADFQRRGMLYARVLTSPHAHAIIRDINVSDAKALPGVQAVLTYKDIPRVPYSSVEHPPGYEGPHDQYSLDSILRYVGDRVAVVAAETYEIAEQALHLIQVEYDVQPALLDPRQALDPAAPCLHPEPESYGIYDASRNIAARVRAEIGDTEQGFASADVVVEGEYFVPAIQSAPLENHTVATYFDDNRDLVVQTSTQVPHHIRRTLARILNIPLCRIRVVKPAVGGGFGVKQEVVLEDLCALLTIATQRPVLLAYSREEEFYSRTCQQCIIRLKTGVMHDGTIVANQMVMLTSTGAHGTHPLTTQSNIVSDALSLYACANMRYVAEVLYTNQPPAAAMRGYGAPQEFFALECHIDEIAQRIKIDALELRRKNWVQVGDAYSPLRWPGKEKDTTLVIESCGLPECLRVVEEKLNWHTKRGHMSGGRFRRGVGLALSLYNNATSTEASGAIIKLNEDGSFDVLVSTSDSSGDARTLLAQIAAEALGVSITSIVMHTSDTTSTPAHIGESASSSLYFSGGAVKRAAEQVRRQLLAVGGRMLNIMPEALKIKNSVISAPDGQTMTVEQVARHSLYVENRHIMTTASWKSQQVPTTFAVQGVEIEVNTETGSIRVINSITALDAGYAINPMIAEGQIQGGVALGLGAGLCEEIIYDQRGKLFATNLRDYHIYSATDMPDMQTHLIETIDAASPFGAKSVAEISLYGVAPALTNALADAIGVRMHQLPLTPERILRAIHAQAATRS